MHTNRRDFLALSTTAALATLAGGPLALAAGIRRTVAPLRILILGGTGFLGPAVIDAAQARGHKVTTFNRGRREKLVGVRDGVEKLYGNRDPEKFSGQRWLDGKQVDDLESVKGLAELEGKSFDGVVDTSGQAPRIVSASATLLAPRVGHYVYISSISAYKSNDKPDMDESDEVATMPDPTVEDMGRNFENYGPLKVLCEQAAEKAMPGRTTAVRAGYIVGPGDTTDRFTYWPVRISRGGEVLAPGAAADPVQFVDVRDLADWIVLCIERKSAGVFNATGPAGKYTNGELLAACQKVSPKTSTLTWVPYSFLEKQQINFPILIPPMGETAGFHTRKVGKAVAAGLKFRAAEETCKSLIDWWPKAVELRARVAQQQIEEFKANSAPEPRVPPADRLRAGPTAEKEAEVLAAWKKEVSGG